MFLAPVWSDHRDPRSLETQYQEASPSELWQLIRRQARAKANKKLLGLDAEWDETYCWQEAGDVAAAVVADLVRHPEVVEAYREERRLSALVARAASRRALKHVRELKNREARQVAHYFSDKALNVYRDEDTDELVSEPYDPLHEPYAALEAEDESRQVARLLDQVPEHVAGLLHRRYLDDQLSGPLSDAEKMVLYRARKSLKEKAHA